MAFFILAKIIKDQEEKRTRFLIQFSCCTRSGSVTAELIEVYLCSALVPVIGSIR